MGAPGLRESTLLTTVSVAVGLQRPQWLHRRVLTMHLRGPSLRDMAQRCNQP